MIAPGATIGILGGGQLGRMLALAAAPLGLKAAIFAPEANSPAFDVAMHHVIAAYDDEEALIRFARSVDVVTYEFENVPSRAAEIVSAHGLLRPGAFALATAQDRLTEKTFIAGLGIPVASFHAVSGAGELSGAVSTLGLPAVLKTRRFGYDGKGQVLLRPEADQAEAQTLARQAPCILEGFVSFEREVSVIVARATDGAIMAYDVCANTHRDHILDTTRLPSGLAAGVEAQAIDFARRIVTALDYVGILTVEMFVTGEGGETTLIVNEIAPRVHNSGHWTIEGAETSQFEQHIRAICGWPLGNPARRGAILMRNLIGNDAACWHEILVENGAHLHLYGKGDARPGRKMGHVTIIGDGTGG